MRHSRLRTILPQEPGLLLATFAASQGIGMMAYWALPILISALADHYELNAAQAGLVGTIEFLGILFGSLVLSPLVSHIPRQVFAFLGAAVVAGANLLTAWLMPELEVVQGLRFLAGLGAGLALAVGNATIANARSPERLANYMTIVLVLYMVIAMPVYARVSAVMGFQGVCLALAGTVVIAALFLFKLPNRSVLAETSADVKSVEAGPAWYRMAGLVALFAVVMFGMRDTLPWLFAEQLGTEAGMSVPATGDLFALMYAFSPLGPVAALLIGRLLPQIWVMFLAMTISAIFGFLIILSNGNALLFQISIVVWGVSYFAAFAELAAFMALLDRGGRLASAMGSGLMLGIMVAPAIGGLLFEMGGYGYVGMAVLTASLIIVGALFFACKDPERALNTEEIG